MFQTLADETKNEYKILVWFDSPQVKRYMKSSTKNIINYLPHKLPNE